MNHFRIPRSALDLDVCVHSGQSFRWSKAGSNEWFGVDGANAYKVTLESESYVISSNGTEESFRALLLSADFPSVRNALVCGDPCMEEIVDRWSGLRLMQGSDPNETLFSFLCTSNNHIKRITPMVQALAAFGDSQALDDMSFKTFPSASRIAALEESELRSLGFGYRARSIPLAAQQICERGENWLENLKSKTYVEAHQELCQLAGVGPKLADCICLYGLHFQEAVPVDTHLWQAACRNFFADFKWKSMTHRRYQEIGDLFRAKFGSYAGWAQLYLYFDNMNRPRKLS